MGLRVWRKIRIICLEPGSVQDAMPALLAALGEQMPPDRDDEEVDIKPAAELLLKLTDRKIKTAKGERRVHAQAQLFFTPPEMGARTIESRRFKFKSPIGPIEYNDIAWYLEDYFRWPFGVFETRAKTIEENLITIGKALYDSLFRHQSAGEVVRSWEGHAGSCDLSVSIMVDKDPPEGSSKAKRTKTEKAATGLLSIPWELLHDGDRHLCMGYHSVLIKRRLPNRKDRGAAQSGILHAAADTTTPCVFALYPFLYSITTQYPWISTRTRNTFLPLNFRPRKAEYSEHI
jgi:hypothetical protein